MRRLVVFWTLVVLSSACQGAIGSPPGAVGDPTHTDAAVSPSGDGSIAPQADASVVGPAADAGPPACAPTAVAVPKLLRLSNHEYRNMVSELLGAPVDEALFSRWTPVAEVYGFDTMSETRIDQQALEVQLDTAEALASIILATPSVTAHCPAVTREEMPLCTSKPSYSARDDFADTQGRECWTYLDSSGAPMVFDNARSLWRKEPDETALLWREGTHPGSTVDPVRRWTSPVTGTATLTGVFADADPNGGDGVLVTIRHNGAAVFSQDLANGAQISFEQHLALTRGDLLEFVVNRKAGPEYDSTAFSAAIAFVPTPRKAAWTWRNCALPLVTKLASRAFRRPIRPEEIQDYEALYRTALAGAAEAGFSEPVDEALKGMLAAVLLSPNFVFKPELVPDGLSTDEKSYGIAARLGLFTRASLPDDALWALAQSGGLRTDAEIRAEVTRILARDVDRFATDFGGQWLAYRDLAPGPLAESMRSEARGVFSGVFSDGLGPEGLLSPGFTVVDPPLAAHYGLPTPAPGGSGRVVTDQRGGLLSQGVFLTRTGAGSEFRRPIHRGLWVLTRLLCRTLPRLDPATLEEINMSFGHIDPSLPLPQQMAIHRNAATRCPTCHGDIDPIGLALEKYDPQGLWRTTYASGAPIETELELNGRQVHDPFELARAIESSTEFKACVGNKLLTFALNRGVQDGEQCVASGLSSKGTLRDMAIEALMKGIELTEVSQ